jgi:probable HAF family extracellular repeat protein
MQDIGSFGGDTFPNAVNDAGMVVGTSYRTGNGESRPFAWTRSRGMIDLGSFGGRFGEALAVSSTGVVVGYSYTAGEVQHPHPFAWTALTGMIDLGTLRDGTSGYAQAVNDNGVVVGYSSTMGNDFVRGFVWRPLHRPQELGTPGRESYASGVSKAGLVVGNNYSADGLNQTGFAWTRDDGMVDLPPLIGQFSQIVGVTRNDVAFGYDVAGGHAMIWRRR